MTRSFMLAAMLCSGCHTQFHAPSMKAKAINRAAFEINCPSEQLSATQLSERQIGVSGCGHRLVYVFNRCFRNNVENKTYECEPLLNSQSEPQVAPAPAPTTVSPPAAPVAPSP